MARRAVAAVAAAAAVAAGAIVAAGAFGADQQGARVYEFTVPQTYVKEPLTEALVVPPGTDGSGRPLLVFLHGFGTARETSFLDSSMFAALARLGSRAPDVLFPDGGTDSYWHNRATGKWASYLLDEVIPRAIALVHADGRRIAIGGFSMGGFGALDVARLHPGRFCAVGGHSAALWLTGADTAPGAFDNAVDFSHHDVIRAAASGNPYGSMPVWLDVGSQDPFRAADTTLAADLRAHGANVQFHVWPGVHGVAYIDAHWDSYFAFYSSALATCGRA